jgi:K+-transporting ATPase KdpF subunit
MIDVIFVATAAGFFALAIGYVISARSCAEVVMIDAIWLSGVTALLLGYLLCALLLPEKF